MATNDLKTMRAVEVPAPRQAWRVVDHPIPTIAPDEVLIKVEASGVCYTDVHLTERPLVDDMYPGVLGHEPAGTIIAVGEAVTTRNIGDRVGTTTLQRSCGRCEWCLSGDEISCGNTTYIFVHRPGGHAQYLAAVARETTLIPSNLSFEQAAPLFCAGYTVMSGLLRAQPQPRDRIAVIGIGGLGHLAVQYSRALGYDTIAVTSNRAKVKLAKDLGADEVVESPEKLGTRSVDIILSTANRYSPAVAAMSALRPRGRVVMMGISDNEPLVVPPAIVFPGMMVNRWSILGSQQNERVALETALRIAADGQVRVMTETYPLKEAPTAFERVKRGEARFRAVLLPQE